MLAIHEGNEGFVVYGEAFMKGLGCILMQKGRVITYASCHLKPHEGNYQTHDLELATILISA